MKTTWWTAGVVAVALIAVLLVPACGKGHGGGPAENPRLTPEGTLKSVVSALDAGNVTDSLNHWVWGANRNQYELLFTRYDQQGMKDFSVHFQTAKLTEQTATTATFQGTTSLAGTSTVFIIKMVKTENGDWAILQVE